MSLIKSSALTLMNPRLLPSTFSRPSSVYAFTMTLAEAETSSMTSASREEPERKSSS